MGPAHPILQKASLAFFKWGVRVPKSSKRGQTNPRAQCFISVCVTFAIVSLAKASCMTNSRIEVGGERPRAWICRRVNPLGIIPARICPKSGPSKECPFLSLYGVCRVGMGWLFQGRREWRCIVEFDPLVSLTHCDYRPVVTSLLKGSVSSPINWAWMSPLHQLLQTTEAVYEVAQCLAYS